MKKRYQRDEMFYIVIENSLYHQVNYDIGHNVRDRINVEIYEMLMNELNVKLINIINDYIKSRKTV